MLQKAAFHKGFFSLAVITIVAVFFGTYSPQGSLLATPKFWRDEAIPFEISRTFLELGKLDVVVAPHEVDGRPFLTHATGFSVTAPLALFMKMFGVGVFEARVFMLTWLLGALGLLFFVMRDFFGTRAAFLGSLLVATFAPFYANGRTVTGEIPGLFFLVLALWLLYRRGRYGTSGFFFGLAAITKPSVFLLIIPALVLEFFFLQQGSFFKKSFRLALGALPVFLVWIWIIVPAPFSGESWRAMMDLYRHPFNEPSLLSRFPGVMSELISYSTLLYVGALTVIVLVAFFRDSFSKGEKRFVAFALLYGIMSLIYFLRSPGWLRYLVIYEIFLLAMLPAALLRMMPRRKMLVTIGVCGLLVLHSWNYFWASDIQSSTASIDTAKFLNEEILAKEPSATIGFIYMPTVAPLISPDRKYQIGTIGGKEVYGMHPLALPPEKLPDYIIGFNGEYENVLREHYREFQETPIGETLYRKK